MIKKLKTKFITLAMISLALLLAAIVAGMNIINYNDVVSDADARLDVLEQNAEGFFFNEDPFDIFGGGGKFFGKRGRGGPFMTQDEAEESRFFTVLMDTNGQIVNINTSRIAAVDDDQAEKYASEVVSKGNEHGFIGEFRYSVCDVNGLTGITFLDCGRVLDSFRDFLKASILMSVIGLLIVFAVISYFAGRIVKPVAESYEKQRRFITDAGHEIKTPLAIIKANLDVIKIDPASTEESLEEIGNQVDRLSGLTNDLVYLSRMEEADTTVVTSELPLSDVVSETADSFEALAKERGKRIEKDIEPMLSVNGNVKDMEKLMSILLENAVKYSSDDEPIKVGLRREGKNVLLEVSNKTSEAVSKESMNHVFERFYRMDESRNSASGGYGIGLSMANAIVNSCGGKITAETNDGNDFIIKVSIPTT